MKYIVVGGIVLVIIFFIIVAIKKFTENKKGEGVGYILLDFGMGLITGAVPGKFDSILVLVGIIEHMENPSEVGGSFNWPYFISGLFFICFGVYLIVHVKKRTYILNINAYTSRNIELFAKNLKMGRFSFKEKEIDIINIYQLFKERYEERLLECIKKEIEKKTRSFLDETREIRRGYTGIAPIPLVMYAGSFIEREKIDDFYEFNKSKQDYYLLSKSRKIKYPDLKVLTPIDNLDRTKDEIVVTVSITQKIEDSSLQQFQGMEYVHIAIDNVADNAIVSKKQLFVYARTIIDTIEGIAKIMPNLKTIKLLCSSQSCLPLLIGTYSIDTTRLPVLISYQYEYQSAKKYPWGLIINGRDKGKLIIE